MSRYRAIMTDTDREHLTGESNPSDTQRHQAKYRTKQRIIEELPRDLEVLEAHHPDLLAELKQVVCDDGGSDE